MFNPSPPFEPLYTHLIEVSPPLTPPLQGFFLFFLFLPVFQNPIVRLRIVLVGCGLFQVDSILLKEAKLATPLEKDVAS